MSFTECKRQVEYDEPIEVNIPQRPLGIRFSHESDNTSLIAYCVRKDATGDKAGLRGGDIVVSVNGEIIPNSERLLEKIRATSPPFKLTIRHERLKPKKSKPRPPPMLGLAPLGDSNPGSPSIEQICLPGSSGIESKQEYPSWSPLAEPQPPPTPQQWFRFNTDADQTLDLSDKWVQEEKAAPSTGATESEITLVSWNVWMSNTCFEERTKAVLSTLERIRPHVFCLQEVTPRFLDALKAQPWAQKEYVVSDNDGTTLVPYGVLICSRLPVYQLQRCSLPTNQGRYFVMLQTRLSGEDVFVGTVHLESQKSTDFRVRQMELIFGDYAPANGHVAVMGDFNFDDRPTDVENKAIPEKYLDCWCCVNCPTREEQLKRGHKGSTRVMKKVGVRYDRMLLSSTDSRWVPASCQILGETPIMKYQGQDMWASDHLGICTILKDTGTDVCD